MPFLRSLGCIGDSNHLASAHHGLDLTLKPSAPTFPSFSSLSILCFYCFPLPFSFPLLLQVYLFLFLAIICSFLPSFTPSSDLFPLRSFIDLRWCCKMTEGMWGGREGVWHTGLRVEETRGWLTENHRQCYNFLGILSFFLNFSPYFLFHFFSLPRNDRRVGFFAGNMAFITSLFCSILFLSV